MNQLRGRSRLPAFSIIYGLENTSSRWDKFFDFEKETGEGMLLYKSILADTTQDVTHIDIIRPFRPIVFHHQPDKQ